MKSILWLGPIVSENEVNRHAAISPAGNNWQIELIKALINNNNKVTLFSHIPEAFWPRSNFISKTSNTLSGRFNYFCLSYLNIYLIRDFILAIKFFFLLEKLRSNGECFDYLFTYNTSKVNIFFAKLFQWRTKARWVSIIADGNRHVSADLDIFLSYSYFKRAKSQAKIHFDGATPSFNQPVISLPTKKVLLFSGTLDKWTGIEELVKSFLQIQNNDWELHIYGKGDSSLLMKLSANSKNIFFKGFVSEHELKIACANAFAFINPRPTDLPGIENNFPSKILHYLSYGKPIISTKTSGISPVYDKLLFYYNPKQAYELEQNLEKVARLDINELKEISSKMELFCNNNSWNNKAFELLKFLSKL